MLRVRCSAVVHLSMGLDVGHFSPGRSRARHQSADLVGHVVAECLSVDVEPSPAKALAVCIAGVRPDGDAVVHGQGAQATHRRCITGMEATGNVDAADNRQQALVVEPLSHVRVDVHRGHGCPPDEPEPAPPRLVTSSRGTGTAAVSGGWTFGAERPWPPRYEALCGERHVRSRLSSSWKTSTLMGLQLGSPPASGPQSGTARSPPGQVEAAISRSISANSSKWSPTRAGHDFMK